MLRRSILSNPRRLPEISRNRVRNRDMINVHFISLYIGGKFVERRKRKRNGGRRVVRVRLEFHNATNTIAYRYRLSFGSVVGPRRERTRIGGEIRKGVWSIPPIPGRDETKEARAVGSWSPERLCAPPPDRGPQIYHCTYPNQISSRLHRPRVPSYVIPPLRQLIYLRSVSLLPSSSSSSLSPRAPPSNPLPAPPPPPPPLLYTPFLLQRFIRDSCVTGDSSIFLLNGT